MPTLPLWTQRLRTLSSLLLLLSLIFERGDWYVDDFLPADGGESEKAYLERYIVNVAK